MPSVCRFAATGRLLLWPRRFAGVVAISLVAGPGLAADFSATFNPQPAPSPSSIGVTISAPLAGTSADSSALSGTATLVVSPSLEAWEDAQLVDLELVLVDGMDFSLLGGAVTASAQPRTARVRMLESGAAGPLVDGQFDQLENLFQFVGEIELSTESEPYDLSTLAPMQADLLGIRLSQHDYGVSATFTVDLEFVAAVAAPPIGQLPLTISLQANLKAVAPLQGSADVDGNGQVDALDIDALHLAIRSQDDAIRFDLNADGALNRADSRLWVYDLMSTGYGDTDLNGRFDSSDLVAVLQRGKYEDALPLNSGWADGDWNGDGESNSSDLVLALQEGCYEALCQAPLAATAAVPEPASSMLVGAGFAWLMSRVRRTRRKITDSKRSGSRL